MEQPHGKTLDLQALAADPVEGNPARADNFRQGAVDGCGIETVEDPGKVVQRLMIQARHGASPA